MAELTRRLCHESGFEPQVACRFANYLLLLQHVESGRSIALLPALAVAPSHAVVTRELTTPVHRNVAIVVRRGSAPRGSSRCRRGGAPEAGGRRAMCFGDSVPRLRQVLHVGSNQATT
jgi:DNA-binding transcriptional LysR family regulator